jgi:hypothetical protein
MPRGVKQTNLPSTTTLWCRVFLTKISHIRGKERDNRPIVVFKVLICAQIVHLDLFLPFCKIDHFNLLCVLFQINNIDECVLVNSID